VIVATAGHVDHGKTLLVKALTGVDADRLPEEKRRGMTIDLGFAYRKLEGGVLGFIDVPGHEDFIHNMLAGVTGIDFALLVVAADEGVMPQTREHAAILDLLDVRRGAIALTKSDRADPLRIEEVAEQARPLFPGVPVFPVSSVTGEGIDDLRAYLMRAAPDARGAASGNFRLSVDRAFTLPGAGIVVTGTVFAGAASVGDTLMLSPRGTPVRVRSIHAQGSSAETAHAGERAALNIAGDLHLADIARGDWIVAERAHAPVRKFDARIRSLAPLAHWTPVHVHLGAAHVTGRVAILDDPPARRSPSPGETSAGDRASAGGGTLVQIVADRPIGVLAGDRFILRDQSARRTLAGGRVVDIYPPARGRARPERVALLRALETADPLPAALAVAPDGVDLARFEQARNLTADQAAALRARVAPVIVDGRAFAPARWAALERGILDALARWHADNPSAPGVPEDTLRRTLDPKPSVATMASAVRALTAAGKLARAHATIRLATHEIKLPPADAALWAKVARELDKAAARPPAVAELAQTLALAPDRLKTFLKRAAKIGLLIQIAENRFARPADVARLAAIAETLATESGSFTAAAFRDRSGLGRNLAIDVLEFFDKAGFTRRHGDARRIAAAGRFGAPAP